MGLYEIVWKKIGEFDWIKIKNVTAGGTWVMINICILTSRYFYTPYENTFLAADKLV